MENTCCCCQGKTKHRTPEEQKKLLNRLCRIEGQVRGLLATHIRTCVADGIRQGDDEVIDELVTTLQKLMK